MAGTNNKQTLIRWIFFIILFSGVFVVFYAATNQPSVSLVSAQQEDADALNNQGIGANCRYGVSSGPVTENPFIDALGVGWILDFGSNPGRATPAGVEYMPMIRMKQDRTAQGSRLPSYTIRTQPLTDAPGGLGPILASYPGRLWIVGNEVDREVWQDDMEPAIYARAYHDVYHFIKQRDPSARVAVSGLVQVTPNRLEYLDKVWNSYRQQFGAPMPVDVWTFHVYILPEARLDGQGNILGSNASIAVGTECYNQRNASTCANIKWQSNGLPTSCPQNNVYCFAEHDNMNIFVEQVVAMRQWMKSHGQWHKPLLLSEFSLLFPYVVEGNSCFLMDEHQNCFPAARVNTFMQQVFNYLETAVDPNIGYPADNNRLVQQWLWYALTIASDEEAGSASRLVSLDGNGNPVGFTAVGEMFQSEIASRASVVNLRPINASTRSAFGVISDTISVEIVNNGNKATTTDYTVSFYRNSLLTDLIGSVTISSGLDGCVSDNNIASVIMDSLVPGANYFWARVSSNEDSNVTDNVTMGFVLVDPQQIFLPAIYR